MVLDRFKIYDYAAVDLIALVAAWQRGGALLVLPVLPAEAYASDTSTSRHKTTTNHKRVISICAREHQT